LDSHVFILEPQYVGVDNLYYTIYSGFYIVNPTGEQTMAIWGDERELTFLKGVGSWSPQEASNKGYSRAGLLKKYYNTMHVRSDWGDIDPNRVRGYLRRCGAHKS
jgi:hypothetical protein